MAFDFQFFAKSLKGFAAELSQVRNNIEKLEREREDILYAPACRSDVTAGMTAWAERRRVEYAGRLEKILRALINVPGTASDPAQVDVRLRTAGLSGDGIQLHHIDIDLAMAGLFGNLLKESLQKTIDALPWPANAGLPMSQRGNEVANIDAQLIKLRATEAKLVDDAKSAGINVE
ncbi:hypothetical protein [Candidatus Nitrotoga arctica]|uniref:Uncharacterized protein n=1 Tax=Candidatus Nitrotoga arctica TaxID=453162 RepID=A0ABM8YY23_9PROT|nr:hypothetical protein [Candidatus Nitrotoga arctica]CAG9932432.1 conserved protein of unknown function [Candidatus Nitrotoga arctica]